MLKVNVTVGLKNNLCLQLCPNNLLMFEANLLNTLYKDES